MSVMRTPHVPGRLLLTLKLGEVPEHLPGLRAFVAAPAAALEPAAAPEPAAALATDELDAERPPPRVSGVVFHAEEPAGDSLAPEVSDSGASGRRWVVVATVFLALVILALAALKR